MDSNNTAFRFRYVRLAWRLMGGHAQLAYWRITSRLLIFRLVRHLRHLREFAELAVVTRTPEGVCAVRKVKSAVLSTLATDTAVVQPAAYTQIQQPLLQLIVEFADTLRKFTCAAGATPGFESLATALSGIMLGDGRIRSFAEPFNGLFINPFHSTFGKLDTPMAVAQALLDAAKKGAVMHVAPPGDAHASVRLRRDLEATLVATGDAARIRSGFQAIVQNAWGLYRQAAIL